MAWEPGPDHDGAAPGARVPGEAAHRAARRATDERARATQPASTSPRLTRRLDGQRGPALLAEPRGAAGDAGVPGLPAPRVPRARVRVPGPRGPPAVPEADGRLAGAGRPRRLHPAAGREDRPLRAPARGDRSPGEPLYFATAITARRLRHRRAGREPHGPADQGRGQPRAPGQPRRHRRLRPGRRSSTLYDPDRSQARSPIVGDIRTWDDFLAALRAALDAQRARRGPGLRILTETVTSPTLAAQLDATPRGVPRRRSGTSTSRPAATARAPARVLAFGEAARDRATDFDTADVVALPRRRLPRRAPAPAALRYTRDHAATPPARRRHDAR